MTQEAKTTNFSQILESSLLKAHIHSAFIYLILSPCVCKESTYAHVLLLEEDLNILSLTTNRTQPLTEGCMVNPQGQQLQNSQVKSFA